MFSVECWVYENCACTHPLLHSKTHSNLFMNIQKAACWIKSHITTPHFFLSPVGNASVHIICDVFLTVAIVSGLVTQHVLLHKSVGAHTKHSVRAVAYCPQCFLQYFYPADFNVIISSMISAQSKTHPPTNNTPLSVKGTKTQTHRVQTKDT